MTTEERMNKIINKTIAEILELLDMTQNEHLKKAVKKKLWDLSDTLQEQGLIKEQSNNVTNTNYNK